MLSRAKANPLGNALAGQIGVTRGHAQRLATNRSNGRAGNLPETIRVKEAAPARELLLDSDEVAAKEAHVHLSIAYEAKARGAALALGEVQYPVRQQAGGGVIVAAVQNGAANPEYPCNEFCQVAALLGQVPGALGRRTRLGCRKPCA